MIKKSEEEEKIQTIPEIKFYYFLCCLIVLLPFIALISLLIYVLKYMGGINGLKKLKDFHFNDFHFIDLFFDIFIYSTFYGIIISIIFLKRTKTLKIDQ